MANKLDISDAKPFDDGVPVDREDRSPGELRGAGAVRLCFGSLYSLPWRSCGVFPFA